MFDGRNAPEFPVGEPEPVDTFKHITMMLGATAGIFILKRYSVCKCLYYKSINILQTLILATIRFGETQSYRKERLWLDIYVKITLVEY